MNGNEYFKNLWNHHFKGLDKRVIKTLFGNQIEIINFNDDNIEILLNDKFFYVFEKELFEWAIIRLRKNSSLTFREIMTNKGIELPMYLERFC